MSARVPSVIVMVLRTAALLLLVATGIAWAQPAQAHDCDSGPAAAVHHEHRHAAAMAASAQHRHQSSGERHHATDCCLSPLCTPAAVTAPVTTATRVSVSLRQPLPPSDIGRELASQDPPTEPPRA